MVPGEFEHRFDFVRASVPAALEAIKQGLDPLLAVQHGQLSWSTVQRGRHGYTNQTVGAIPGARVIVEILHGGVNARPSVEFSGDLSPLGALSLRQAFPAWMPSRLDTCVDVTAPGLFERLLEWSEGFAAKWSIKRQRWLADAPDEGSTIYLGARVSALFVRIYQVGLKVAALEGRTGDQITQAERDAVRIEVEYKPQKRPAKIVAATLQPADLWTLSPWVADFANTVLAMDIRPISISERRESDRDRALRWCASQYANHFASLLHEYQGDVEAFGSHMLRLSGILNDDLAADVRLIPAQGALTLQ